MGAEPPPTAAAPPPQPPTGLARLIALNASALTIGRLLNAVLGIIGIGITSRYLGVDLFATLVTVTAFTVLFAGFADMGVATIGARELAKRPDDTRRLLDSLFTIGIALQLFAAAIVIASASIVYSGTDGSVERESILLLVLPPLLLSGAAAPATAYLLAAQRGYAAAVASTVASVAMTLILVLAVTLDLGFTAVLIAHVAQSIAFVAVMLAFALPRIRFLPSWDPALSKQLLGWALPLGVVLILTSLYWRIDIVLLSIVGTQQDVGIYGLAYKVADTFYVIPAFVMVTLLPAFARLAQDAGRRDELVQKMTTVMPVAVAPLVVLTVAFADEITTIAGGDDFDGAAPVLQILMFGVAAGFLRAVLTEALIAVNRQVWLMYATGALLAVNVALNLVLIPVLGARGAAAAFAASEAVALVLVALLFRRIGVMPRPHQMPQLLMASAAMAGVTLLKLVPLAVAVGPVATIVVLGPLSVVVYVACLYALGAMPREVDSTLVAPALATLRELRRR
ncbi:MAG: oligosaccharide flippase family protein [Solirubrobacteraceae bacterium]